MRSTLKNPYVYLLFVLPTIALYFLFFIYPMLTSFYYGFTNWNGLDTKDYVGFANFANAFKDADFRHSILNNLIILLFSCCIQVPLIIVCSLLISGVKRLQGFYKTTVFMPSILSTSVIGILWGFIYDPDVGLLDKTLRSLGAPTIYWLADTNWALPAILITNAWQWMGFYIVLILAAILAIPREIDEAARIDGATGPQRAWYLTVPLIKPIINVVIMLSIAGALRVVDIVLVMTGGGPAGATDVMASYMVNKAIKYSDYGYGTALSIIIFAFALVLTALYQILFARRQERVEF
ncbi:carbohydrate ABC transporter permease [Cohnella zeiphila]|uniref:Sugar ABC transporter permease n=1 Tax=Cohnella zeiphila TaxID=2761120 RepID=A0A7X0SS41_9BACL|nr:sugar ABC transporter permease [Cohnella zeiphila]MBB6735064.1 sugar ABC transporter permease [Cohnella zeiphila]